MASRHHRFRIGDPYQPTAFQWDDRLGGVEEGEQGVGLDLPRHAMTPYQGQQFGAPGFLFEAT
jgi:hypothetical protein